MDTASIIIGLVVLGLFAGPVVYAIWQTKNKENKDRKAFETFAQANRMKISLKEGLGSSVIGIDTENHKLLYFSEDEGEMRTRIVDLRGLMNCSVQETAGSVNDSKGRSRKTVFSIGLRFDFLGRPSDYIQLFDAQKTLWPNGEGPFAEKWCGIINGKYKLSNKPIQKAQRA